MSLLNLTPCYAGPGESAPGAHPGDLLQLSGHGVGFDRDLLTRPAPVGMFNLFDAQGNRYGIDPDDPFHRCFVVLHLLPAGLATPS